MSDDISAAWHPSANYGYDICGFSPDFKVTWQSVDFWGDDRWTTWTLLQLSEIIYSHSVYVRGRLGSDMVKIDVITSSESIPEYKPTVWDVTLTDGYKITLPVDHKILDIDLVRDVNAVVNTKWAGRNGEIYAQLKRVLTPSKYKPPYFMNVATQGEVPWADDHGVMHGSARKIV